MDEQRFVSPIDENDVPKVENAIAVGEDLRFQERWWKFERIVWAFFLLVLIADVLGVFGEGWLAKAECHEKNSGIDLWYDRVERTSSPDTLRVRFRPEAVANAKAQLFVSESLVKQLGAQRITPQPESSTVGADGIRYTFPASGAGGEVQIEIQPPAPGVRNFTMQVPGMQAVTERVVVMP